jgi:hypothetical protein
MRVWLAKFRDMVVKNPYAWLLLALFALAEYNNYKKGVLLDRLCELTGPHDVGTGHPKNDREELDNICIDRLDDSDE